MLNDMQFTLIKINIISSIDDNHPPSTAAIIVPTAVVTFVLIVILVTAILFVALLLKKSEPNFIFHCDTFITTKNNCYSYRVVILYI